MHIRWSWHEQNYGMISEDSALTLSVKTLWVLKMSGFNCHVSEACAFRGCYAVFVNRRLPTLWNKVFVPFSRIKQSRKEGLNK